jgi:hypothetical protein
MTQRQQSGFLKDIVGAYIPKDPHAELQYGVDWTDWLGDGDSITSATWAVESTATNAITLSNDVVFDNVTAVTVTGGSTGTIYTVAVNITTAEEYIDTRRFRIKCENRFL